MTAKPMTAAEYMDWRQSGVYDGVTEWMEHYAAYRANLAVREALGEAAKIVEQEANDGANFRNFVIDPHWITHRIRALMPEAK